MKKTGIFILAIALLCMTSGEILARPSHHHHGRHWHHRSYTSIGFVYGMTPRYYYPYHAYVAAIPIQSTTVNYIQRSADEISAPQYWYYCTDPQGYYPYVRECRGSWKKVPPFPSQVN
jgi:hypothetical protein